MNDNELLQLIDQAARESWTELDLSNQWFTELPPEIGKLINLRSLKLRENNILQKIPPEIGQLANLESLDLGSTILLTEIPPQIGNLTRLNYLDLSGHQWWNKKSGESGFGKAGRTGDFNAEVILPPEIWQLVNLIELNITGLRMLTIPSGIGQLINLRSLRVGYNELVALPPTLGELTELETLDLSGNKLSFLPYEIGQLTNLRHLDLSRNQLNSLPHAIGQLTNLETLNLSHNQLDNLPRALRKLTKLDLLKIDENPLHIPPELRGGRPQEILNVYFQSNQPLHEARLFLLGEGSVGKSSLVERIIWNRPPGNKGKTIGVDIHSWQIKITPDNDQPTPPLTSNKDIPIRITPHSIHLNIWDFGGQEIYHATHQFFLTHRSLYLIVIDARQDEEANRLDYWLRHAQSFGGDSPIILVVNKIDQGRRPLDERGLLNRYPQLRDIIYTSCTQGDGIKLLVTAIQNNLLSIPHIHDKIPETWLAVKGKLAALQKDYIAYESYMEICQAEGIHNTGDQRTLARFLHDLGVILNFQDDRRLEDTHVLNPEWVTTGIYRILNDDSLQGRGLLSLPDLDLLLDPAVYPRHKHRFLLEIMSKFELCVPLTDGKHYLIPGLLSPERPVFLWPVTDVLRFQIRYALLPASILARLMVRLYHHTEQEARWRDGMILTREAARALITANRADKQLDIEIDGSPNNRRYLLNIIRAELNEIHATFARLEVAEWVPILTHPGQAIAYADLLFYAEQEEWTPLYGPIRGRIDVKALLDGIELPAERDIRIVVRKLIEVFNRGELRDLAFEMGIDHEELPQERKSDLARELVLYCQRQGHLDELERLATKARRPQ